MISKEELSALIEHVHLTCSPENAKRLYRALEWSKSKEATSQSIEELKQELGFGEEA